MRVRIQHTTRYLYDQPAALGPHVVRLRPADHRRTELLSYALNVEPVANVHWQFDPWGNRIARLTFGKEKAARELELVVDASFDIRPINPFDFFIDDRCERIPFAYPDGLQGELAPFLSASQPGPRVAEFLADVPEEGKTVDWLADLNRRVAASVRYIIRAEAGIQAAEETLDIGSGSCRDSAVLLVEALRARGLAARFVSGYLVQLADEGIIPDQAKGVAQDVVDLHAWAEVFVPGAGWVGLDGTSGLLCGEGHIPLATAVDPRLAAPVDGTASQAASGFEFALQIERLGHEPRPRRPYTDETWQEIRLAGDEVDRKLSEAGVLLTCGGEPTWTSRLHPLAEEWNTAALGASKWEQGLRLVRELRHRFDPGTAVLSRMGKHYPGESLPRWAVDLIWRRDGVPVWRNEKLLDLDGGHMTDDIDAALATAEAVVKGVAQRLGVTLHAITGYEDPWQAIADEENLPSDVDPLRADLDDPEERRRLARLLGRGLGKPVGLALPLSRRGGAWLSKPWNLRRGQLFLVPGDSPMGLRLPLDRLVGDVPWVPPVDVTAVEKPIAFDPRRERRRATKAVDRKRRRTPESTADFRTTLCVEPRDGAMCVFLPPVDSAEAFLELVAAVEDVAADLDHPVRLEGYKPPRDPRLDGCSVTPDPGVLEVNLPVTTSFSAYADLLVQVTEAANAAGLTNEKYQLDGREVGSGGGNHLTLGGPSTVESPFLMRPALLAHMLRYLQHHPSLSYLFSGLFVGPTSQAPRIDEARHDALYELEIALARAEQTSDAPPPWLTDRLFRNLLTDVAGNTHRTEVSIDKLYDPAGVAGRQGLVELRAFEMPPHEHMAAVQMLLARSLVARCARAPVTGRLVRWGSQLHDRFLLPHHLWSDFRDVVADLNRHDLPLEEEWFRPFLEFRCPVVGRLQLEDISLELRSALEPWLTLGEEPAGATTSRYVDSSLERLQVCVDGLVEGRHVVAVNGVELPLRPTGVASRSVAGVRFRAWQPPHCLHPTIPIHHPLRFEVIDTWARRALGGCVYHVSHPGGRGYDEPPVTAFEAAARRAQRFVAEGHQSFPATWRAAPEDPDQPHTLDLRRVLDLVVPRIPLE